MRKLVQKARIAIVTPAFSQLQQERSAYADEIVRINQRGQEWVDYAVRIEGERDHLIVVARNLTIDLDVERDRSATLAARLEAAERRCVVLAKESEDYRLTFDQHDLPGYDERTMPLPDPEAYLEQSIWQIPRGENVGRATAPVDVSQDDTQQVKAA